MLDHAAEKPPGLTIVGGQPTPGPVAATVDVPRGIERLLLRAAADDSFARHLVEQRAAALAEVGEELSAVERAALAAVGEGVLRAMIAAVARTGGAR